VLLAQEEKNLTLYLGSRSACIYQTISIVEELLTKSHKFMTTYPHEGSKIVMKTTMMLKASLTRMNRIIWALMSSQKSRYESQMTRRRETTMISLSQALV
jgi:hypothetical protein